ncbi:MAG: penicillin-binding protein 2 [Planctomycetota bacterium]
MIDPVAAQKRADWLFGLLVVLFAALGWRLWSLQVDGHVEYASAQRHQTWAREELPARPGGIFSRDLESLALSKPVESVCLVPPAVQDARKTASTLAQILGVSAAKLVEDLAERRVVATGLTEGRRKAALALRRPEVTVDGDRLLVATRLLQDRDNLARRLAPAAGKPWGEVLQLLAPQRGFLWVKRWVSPAEAEAVRKAALPGVEFRDEYRRFYPGDSTGAPQVVGWRGRDNVGLGGIEFAFDKHLAGSAGERWTLRDARQQRIPSLGERETPARAGNDVVTTLDTTLQLLAEQQLDEVVRQWSPKAATCIVMDPRTGEVLALACRPTFNPNYAGNFPADSQRNRAITDPSEPGSTFKGIVFAGALQEKLFSLTDSLDCEGGSYTLPWGRTVHDHHSYGLLSVLEILTKSSNIGMAKIGMRLGETRLHRYVTAFGFGSPTGLGLPGESGGILRPLMGWTPDSTPSIAFGHEVSVTPMQLATAYCAVANGGWLLKPQIVLRVTDEKGNVVDSSETTVLRRVISEKTAFATQQALSQVVDKGTGSKAKVKGYSVAGKTGTAQKLLSDGRYSHEKYVSSFLAFAPAHDARVLVLVSVDEPRGEGILYGGTVAAPHVGQLLAKAMRHLEVEPDRPEEIAAPEELGTATDHDAAD